MNTRIEQEISQIESPEFKLGEYIYMGMGIVAGHTVCLSVAYKIDYCIRKAYQFEFYDSNVKFTHVNKVKVGELTATETFTID